MPQLAAIEIPVLSQSHSSGERSLTPRLYSDEPLPIKPSGRAPRNARILGREQDSNGVNYKLKIGDVVINDVGIDEILDYVSAFELEEYENAQFEEEREVRKVVEAETRRRRLEKLERMKERAERKGVVLHVSDEDSLSNDDSGEDEETLGKHGRKRPVYSQFFKQPIVQRRRKRDPATGELMPLSDDGEDISSEDMRAMPLSIARPTASLSELPKQRRRKRDRITGELLPLSPVKQPPTGEEQKRQRRVRHPLTGELMPLGWRYDPNDPKDTYESRRPAPGSSSFRKLSISQEHEPKRQRLVAESEATRSSSSPRRKLETAEQQIFKHGTTGKAGTGLTPKRNVVIGLGSSGDESDGMPTGSLEANEHPSAPKSVASPSSARRRQASPVKTSIMHPSATRASSTDPIAQALGEGDTEDSEDDEWFIEGILSHSWSNPKTHPPGLGSEPVILYQVKWEGYDEPTWEPIDSFPDISVVEDYRRLAGLDPQTRDLEMDDDEDIVAVAPAPKHSNSAMPEGLSTAANDEENEDEELDDGEYEIESIVAHHLSDPRTHPRELGKVPVMLYQVKWKGYEERTWEPESIFENQEILRAYQRRQGLIKDEDHVMAEAGS